MKQNKLSFKWQDLERIVRMVAEAKFGSIARAEDIAGVRCDCVIHQPEGSVVLIEISREDTIDKLRTDIAKFNVLRPHFFQKNIFPRCYFITLQQPTPALINAGAANFVNVRSAAEFFNEMLGVSDYISLRQKIPFGSAIDLYSGEPDQNQFIQVNYFADDGEVYNIERVCNELVAGKTIVLIGDYGTGKSRCVKESFDVINKGRDKHFKSVFAINLRDNWGLKRAREVITRHLEDMGLAPRVADVLKTGFTNSTIYLLDGFDEIGAQTWSDDPGKLVDIRKASLVGVKDLIGQTKGGLLITGREHYFNTDEELITCLGLENKNPLFLRCNQELTESQFSEMLGRQLSSLPAWIPKKPLIATLIRDIESTIIDGIFSTSSGQIDFWDLLITTLCEREAKINSILDASIIRSLYIQLGRVARTTECELGPVSIKRINEAFERVTGRPPTDESAIILQRLPGLGRIGAESLDRQFVDPYILDGLKAEDTLAILSQGSSSELDELWLNPVGVFGAFFIASRLESSKQIASAIAFIKRYVTCVNKIIVSDLLAALFTTGQNNIDMGNVTVAGCKFHHICLAESGVTNIVIDDSTFASLDITDASPEGIKITNSVISTISGVTAKEHIPNWLVNCLCGEFQNLNTLAKIREAGLSLPQTFLLSSLRKLFLQPGGGRKESSMYKGYGNSNAKRVCEKIITLLVQERFCQKFRGATETLYVPNRSLISRVKKIMSQLTNSQDELWLRASKIKE